MINKVFTKKKIVEAEQIVAQGEMMELPGNSAFLFSHSVFVSPDHQGKGIGTEFMKERILQARKDFPAAEYILALVNPNNEPQMKLMKKFGWGKVGDFEVSSSPVCLFSRLTYTSIGMGGK